jgi:hypothetical protein
MLQEMCDVRQIEGEGRRRWFSDQYFDLIVWYDTGGAISGFQLCYDIEENERALTWMRDKGFSHDKIDDGQISGRAKMTPVLVADGLFAKETIAALFKAAAGSIASEIASFVYEKIKSYPGG